MSDQGQWFKLWCSSVDDPELSNLSNNEFAVWAKLGAFTKKHGAGGVLKIPAPAKMLCAALQVTDFEELCVTIGHLPNVQVSVSEGSVTGVTIATVTFNNWSYYQGDNSAHRVRAFRDRVTSKKRGEEKRGEENIKPTPPSPSSEGTAAGQQALPMGSNGTNHKNGEKPWPSPEALIALYNAEAADELPAVEAMSPARLKKAREYLRSFPRQEWWLKVFQETKRSLLLRGLRPSEAHPNFKGDFDWLLSKGRDNVENCAKVWEEKYRDA